MRQEKYSCPLHLYAFSPFLFSFSTLCLFPSFMPDSSYAGCERGITDCVFPSATCVSPSAACKLNRESVKVKKYKDGKMYVQCDFNDFPIRKMQ